jgi:hypothetical protein
MKSSLLALMVGFVYLTGCGQSSIEGDYKELDGQDGNQMRSGSSASGKGQVRFEPNAKEKKIIDYTHLANVCAGFYSRWGSNATRENCKLSGDENDLKCRAWATKDRLEGWYEYVAEKEAGNIELLNYLKNREVFEESFRYGANSGANNDVSLSCYNYLYNNGK